MERTLIIPPDAYFMWALFPDTLLNYDKVIMCKSDFEDREDKKDRSRYDNLVATALHQYNENGFVEVWDLKDQIEPSTLGIWNAVAGYIISETPPAKVSQAGSELLKHWVTLCDSKMMFYSASEPEFQNVNADKKKALWIIDAIEKTGQPPEGSDIVHIVKLSLIKAFVCMEMSELTRIPFHDLPTLRPVIGLIAEFFGSQASDQPHKLEEGSPLLDHILMPLYRMASTGLVYDSPSCMRQLITDRQDFVTYRSALRELDGLYREIKRVVLDDETAQANFEVELVRIRGFVDSELAKIRKRQKALLFPLALLSSVSIPGLTVLAQNAQSWLEEKQMSSKIRKIDNTGDIYKWFYAFQKLTGKPVKSISPNEFQIQEPAEHTSWCSGKLPWYYIDETPKPDSEKR